LQRAIGHTFVICTNLHSFFLKQQLLEALDKVLHDQQMQQRLIHAAKAIGLRKSKKRACDAIELCVEQCGKEQS